MRRCWLDAVYALRWQVKKMLKIKFLGVFPQLQYIYVEIFITVNAKYYFASDLHYENSALRICLLRIFLVLSMSSI